MGWGKAHTSPEADLAGLRSELAACRIEIERLRRHMRLVMPLEHVTPEPNCVYCMPAAIARTPA